MATTRRAHYLSLGPGASGERKGPAVRREGAATEPPLFVVLRSDLQGVAGGQRESGAWGEIGNQLWPAWRALDRWENDVEGELGATLGKAILVLWAIARLGEGDESTHILDELITDDLSPRFGDPVVEDIAQIAFALGAGWNQARMRGGTDDAARQGGQLASQVKIRRPFSLSQERQNREREQSAGDPALSRSPYHVLHAREEMDRKR